jgi:hypothetical protein
MLLTVCWGTLFSADGVSSFLEFGEECGELQITITRLCQGAANIFIEMHSGNVGSAKAINDKHAF